MVIRYSVLDHLANWTKETKKYFRDLVCSVRIWKVEDLDVTFCRADDEKRVLDIECIAPFRQLNGSHWVRCPQIPILGGRLKNECKTQSQSDTHFDSLVPTSCCQNACIRRIDPSHDFYRCIMKGYLRCLTSHDIKHSSCVVSTTWKDLVAFLNKKLVNGNHTAYRRRTYFIPTNIQDRPLMLVHCFTLRLTIRSNFVNANLETHVKKYTISNERSQHKHYCPNSLQPDNRPGRRKIERICHRLVGR